MVESCCICHKRPSAGTSIHRIPKVNLRMTREYVDIMKARRKAWIRVLERTQVLDFGNLDRYFVCSKHFMTGKPSDFRKQEDVDWIPSIECGEPEEVDVPTVHDRTEMTTADDVERALSNIPTDELEEEDEEDLREFFDVMSSFRRRKGGEPEIEKAADQSFDELQTTLFGMKDSAIEKVTNPQAEDCEKAEMTALIKSLQAQVISQDERINELEKAVERLSWTESTFELDDKKMLFYTGLQSLPLLKLILSYIEIPMNEVLGGTTNLTNFQKLLLMLMKLRHNISYTGLSYHFNIRVREASIIFRNVVVIIYETFSMLVHWPERECLRRNVPKCFKEAFADKLAITIDCFEIKTGEPAKGRAQAQMDTQCEEAAINAKYLIGITSSGFIAFVSDGYIHAWDEFITNDCGILDNLMPGDIVLTKCGSTVNEVVCPTRDAKLDIPDFTDGRAARQLRPLAIEATKEIAAVRIHVGKEIRQVRNRYSILKGPVPFSFVREKYKDKTFLDIVVSVCCMLTNLRDSTS